MIMQTLDAGGHMSRLALLTLILSVLLATTADARIVLMLNLKSRCTPPMKIDDQLIWIYPKMTLGVISNLSIAVEFSEGNI